MRTGSMRSLRLPLVLLATVLLSLGVFCWSYLRDNKYTRRAPGAKTGIMPLNVEEYLADPLLFLVDGWEFYQYRLLGPDEIAGHAPDAFVYIGQYGGFELDDPTASPHGSATYRLTIFTDEINRDYALELPEIYSSYRVWVNGTLRHSQGVDERADTRAQTANTLIAFSAADKVEIVIAVTDHSHFYSGVTYPPAFGSPERVNRMLGLRMALRGLALGTAALIGLLCLLLAAWQRFAGQAHLLSLLCLCFMGYTSYPVIHAIPLSGMLWYDLERVSYYAMFLVVILLQGRLCGLPRRVYRPAVAVAVLPCVSIPLYQLWGMGSAAGMYRFSALLSAYILAAGMYLFASTCYTLLRGNAYSQPLLCGFAVFACALIFNRANPLFEPILLGWHTELAGFVLVLIVAGTVGWDAALAYRESRILREREQAALTLLEGERERAHMQRSFSEEMLKLRHDIKSQLLALQTHLTGGRYDRLEQELAARLGELGEITYATYTGHDLVDAFLSSAMSRAKRCGVRMELKMSEVPPSLSLQSKDLAALLSNILDNALEACERMAVEQERWVRLELVWHEDLLMLDCQNTHCGGLRVRRGHYSTDKQDRERHGYGLRIVKEIVDRTRGVLEVSHTDECFRVYLTLPAECAPPKTASIIKRQKGISDV